jgi:hypothetical protein
MSDDLKIGIGIMIFLLSVFSGIFVGSAYDVYQRSKCIAENSHRPAMDAAILCRGLK